MVLGMLHAFFAFVAVVFLVLPLRKVARLSGIVDQPGGRKKHDKAVPPIGGIIIFSVFMIYSVLFGIVDLHVYWPLYSGLVLLLMVGALDDQLHIPAKLKFLVHIGAAVLIAFWGDVKAAYLGDLFGIGDVWTSVLAYPFTLAAIVLLINAMNLTDGLDGLAGGVSFVMFAWFGVAAFVGGWMGHVYILMVLMACLAGFLVFNFRNPWRRRASLFLGDAGSMSLGLCLAWFGVLLARGPGTPIEPIAVAWILGFPIFDTCAQFYRRVQEGKSPFAPDRGHFHHHFIDAGVPVHIAVPVIVFLVMLMGGIGYAGTVFGVPPFLLTIGWVALLWGHVVLSRKPERYVSIIRRCCGYLKLCTA